MNPTIAPQSFGQIYFGLLDLGDARVGRRTVDPADTLRAAAADSWPDTFAGPADSRTSQRLVNRPQAAPTRSG